MGFVLATAPFMHLAKKKFFEIVKNAPLAAIDLILTDRDGKILVGKRKNNPAKGKWFVPGGRIRKNETFEKAIQRLCREEVPFGRVGRPRFLGAFEHFYRVNAGGSGFGTHYVVLAYHIRCRFNKNLLATSQHGLFRLFSPQEALRHRAVHANTRIYARQNLSS